MDSFILTLPYLWPVVNSQKTKNNKKLTTVTIAIVEFLEHLLFTFETESLFMIYLNLQKQVGYKKEITELVAWCQNFSKKALVYCNWHLLAKWSHYVEASIVNISHALFYMHY